MQHLTVDAVLGQIVEIDLCASCRAFWFEPFETIHLTPRSTLLLFGVIAEQAARTNAPAFPTTSYCPTCHQRLILTHDRQRTTPFEYWRCDAGHGRFTPFVDFLREKDFIRPLSPQQVKELRENVQMIHCANCGAPIDLTKDSLCPHCGAPLSMLDMKKMRAMASEIQKSNGSGGSRPAGSSPPPDDLSQLFATRAPTPNGQLPSSLVELGLDSVASWIVGLLD